MGNIEMRHLKMLRIQIDMTPNSWEIPKCIEHYTNSQCFGVVNHKIYHEYFLFTVTIGSGEFVEI